MKKATSKNNRSASLDDLARLVNKGFADVSKSLSEQNKLGLKNSTDIEDLAIMIQKGFTDQDKKFNKRFDDIDSEIYDIKTDVNKLTIMILDIQSKIGTYEQRLKSIEGKLDLTMDTSKVLKINWREHEIRLTRIEKQLGLIK